MRRCCADTLKWHPPKDPIEGLELACHYGSGDCFLRFEHGVWVEHDALKDRIDRMVERLPSQQARIAEILGKPQP